MRVKLRLKLFSKVSFKNNVYSYVLNDYTEGVPLRKTGYITNYT